MSREAGRRHRRVRRSAILLLFEATFRTGDVDARVESGDHGAVLEAARLPERF